MINVQNKRIRCFDTLRFFAAVIVLVNHASWFFPTSLNWILHNWGICNAKSAVAFFFVLSGLVLHQSGLGAGPTGVSIGRFLAHRWFRIYPLYYVSLILGAAALCLPLETVAALRTEVTAAPVVLAHNHWDLAQWINHLMLITPGLDFDFINPPIWTLAAEMRIALVFPVLSFVVSRLSMGAGGALLGISFAAAPAMGAMTVPTIALIPLFIGGAWLAQHRRQLPHLPQAGWLVVLTVGVVLYVLAPWLCPPSSILHLYVAGFGSLLILPATENCQAVRQFLEARIPVVFNDTSYGIYVLHFPLLLGVAYGFNAAGLPAWLFVPISILLTFIVAVIFNRLVEMPMIALGRRLTRSRPTRI
ncbi:MAG: acyltransferase [Verrucomicrobia bacterium]|nr:acyltransferase [Verrucomicrobiota bacterium]